MEIQAENHYDCYIGKGRNLPDIPVFENFTVKLILTGDGGKKEGKVGTKNNYVYYFILSLEGCREASKR